MAEVGEEREATQLQVQVTKLATKWMGKAKNAAAKRDLTDELTTSHAAALALPYVCLRIRRGA